ncbi:MAG TPA: type III pantothenate kinase [Candidatus Krumholzibacteria bacterium]|nr:type III pantothenate kinase [Candidatus Krumholzibacteria bacterium]HPD72812.1 type III pantothenate kinase [Candidatus Krumholzibacteria bacterium]HRY40256.1 type III pantothenate kinase [Candidatus Krumholzibacteria bacterium]
MSQLLVNIGNSCVSAARAEPAARGSSPAVAGLLREPTPRDAAALAALAARIAGLRRRGETAGVCSVVPAAARALVAAMPDAHLVDHTWDFPFAVSIREPRTVGADRWCNVAAAAAAALDDALVVDAGTATTIDVLAAGVFTGGLIAPGMAFAARKLQEEAAQLWPVPFAPCELRPGRDTEEALAIGAFHVGVHGVAGVVEALLAAWPRSRVITTGGLGGYVARAGWLYDPDWTLRGLAALLDRRRHAGGATR